MKKLFIFLLFLSVFSLEGQTTVFPKDTILYLRGGSAYILTDSFGHPCKAIEPALVKKKKKKSSDSAVHIQLSENYPPQGMVRPTIKKWDYNRSLLGFSVGLIGGASWGLHETLNYHYSSFKRVHPKADDQWWDPEISWQNKNTSSLPFSRSLFVFFTDAKHGLAGINTLALVGGTCIVTIGEKREWWEYLIDLGIMSVGRSIGFYTVYNVIYK